MDVNLQLGVNSGTTRRAARPESLVRRRSSAHFKEPDFEPKIEWVHTPEAQILVAELPGFKKDDVKVQFDASRNLIVSGERTVEEFVFAGGVWHPRKRPGNKFKKVFTLPDNVNTGLITAKFENEMLHVTVPKLGTPPEIRATGMSDPEKKTSQVGEKIAETKDDRPTSSKADESRTHQMVESPQDRDGAKASTAAQEAIQIKGTQLEQNKAEDLAKQPPEIKKAEDLAKQPPETKKAEELAKQPPETNKAEELPKQPPEENKVEELAKQSPEKNKAEVLAKQPPEEKKTEKMAKQPPEENMTEKMAKQRPEGNKTEELGKQPPEEQKAQVLPKQPPEENKAQVLPKQPPEEQKAQVLPKQPPEENKAEEFAKQRSEGNKDEELPKQTPEENKGEELVKQPPLMDKEKAVDSERRIEQPEKVETKSSDEHEEEKPKDQSDTGTSEDESASESPDEDGKEEAGEKVSFSKVVSGLRLSRRDALAASSFLIFCIGLYIAYRLTSVEEDY